MWKTLFAVAAMTLLAACGGGGGSVGSIPTIPAPAPTPALTNFVTVTVDSGPAALAVGPSAYSANNILYVSVTLCAPGGSTCQTVDHVQVDTGSAGLRILKSAISTTLLAALPNQTDVDGNAVGECFGFVDGYVFGSVRHADTQIGGESIANMALQVVGDDGPFAAIPASCSSGGGTNLSTVFDISANGILGIGISTTDCGASCTVNGGSAAATYYDCPAGGCAAIIGRAASAAAPFQQLPNPVAAMAVNNTGSIIDLPAAAANGQTSLSGTLYFGIGTQTNNALAAARILPTTAAGSPSGSGLISVIYKGQTLSNSIIDSGTNFLAFDDTAITPCVSPGLASYYCPPGPLSLSATLQGVDGTSTTVPFTLVNAETLFAGKISVAPGVGGSAGGFTNSLSGSFDFAIPFFFGRKIYTGIEGRSAGIAVGPFFAF